MRLFDFLRSQHGVFGNLVDIDSLRSKVILGAVNEDILHREPWAGDIGPLDLICSAPLSFFLKPIKFYM